MSKSINYAIVFGAILRMDDASFELLINFSKNHSSVETIKISDYPDIDFEIYKNVKQTFSFFLLLDEKEKEDLFNEIGNLFEN